MESTGVWIDEQEEANILLLPTVSVSTSQIAQTPPYPISCLEDNKLSQFGRFRAMKFDEGDDENRIADGLKLGFPHNGPMENLLNAFGPSQISLHD